MCNDELPPCRRLGATGVGLLMLAIAGCMAEAEVAPKVESPRPVRVFRLYETTPGVSEHMTGSVDSWKTEEIGFEVPGRVRWVIEPEEEVEGRRLDRSTNRVLTPGSVIAQLDDERYRFAVEAAAAAVEQAQRQKESIEIEIERTLPARIQAAVADEKLARIEFDRRRRLLRDNATPQAEVDRAEAQLATASSQVATLEAELEAKRSELRSVESQIKQAEQNYAEAKRDLDDCSLYSWFRGQIAEVHVVPGSVVAQGAPVVTVQMMDPIKVEVEVSADVSRRLRRGDTLRLHATDTQGNDVPLFGLVYMTDPLADPETRTFTVTILTRNERVRLPVPPEMQGGPIARTTDILPLNLDFIDGGKSWLVEKDALRSDAQGSFVWRIKNRQFMEVTPGASPILEVEKLRVIPGDVRIPFLGNWTFVPVAFPENANFDRQRVMVARELSVDEGDPNSWDGDKILFDPEQWMLRPGDVVRIDLGADPSEPGLYVPMNALRNESGRSYVFVVDETVTPPVARQREVRVESEGDIDREKALQRIEPIDANFPTGAKVIVEGVHFLHDGEPIAIVPSRGLSSTESRQADGDETMTTTPVEVTAEGAAE